MRTHRCGDERQLTLRLVTDGDRASQLALLVERAFQNAGLGIRSGRDLGMDPEGVAVPDNVVEHDREEAALQTPLDYLEGLLSDGRSLLLGERVSLADGTLQASLQFMRFIEADLFGDRPLLRAWDERYRARPAAQKVLRW